ncbi:MAG: thioesterase family protein [Rhizobiaceae bacterium]
MTRWRETHRAFVNTWECDENAHLNVRFYLKRFDEAARIHAAMTGHGTPDGPLPRTRHVRYHRELLPGAMTRIRSDFVGDGPFQGWTVHLLEDVGGNQLAATALDAPAGKPLAGGVSGSELENALPRGLPPDHLAPLPPAHILDNGGLVANRGMVVPSECDAAGRMMQQFYVARMTDAAPHVWEHAGIGISWLDRHGYGRVAAEMKLTHHDGVSAGDMLFLHGRAEIAGRKTLKLRHEIVRYPDMTPVLSAEVLALILDLKTRRSVALPEIL